MRLVIGEGKVVGLKSGGTTGDLIDKLEEEYGSAYRKITGEGLKDTVQKLFNLSINGKLPAPGRNFNEMLNDGDDILFYQWTGA